MNTTTVKAGDTLESISVEQYGTPDFAEIIRSANPNADGGIVIGMALNIPPQEFGIAARRSQVDGVGTDISINIEGERFRFWEQVELTRAMDMFDRFSLQAPFEANNEAFRRAFIPFAFQDIQIFVGADPRFTGTMVNLTPNLTVERRTVVAEGYAKAGVLNDCPMPIPQGSSALEFNKLDINSIFTQMARPFGLVPVFAPGVDVGPPIERTAVPTVETKVLQYWAKLAKERSLVIGNDVFGQPLIQQTTTAGPIERLEEGIPPLLSVVPQFNPQTFFSHITAITPGAFEVFGNTRTTLVNPHLQGVLRPFTYKAEDTFGADADVAVRAKMGRMFGNAIEYVAAVAGLQMSNGELWEPNTLIKLTAPSAFIYNETEFLVRSVSQKQTDKTETTRLGLVLPGSFNGTIPEVLPWQT